MIYSGVAAALVLFTSFIPSAVYAAQFGAFNSNARDDLSQNVLSTSTGISGTLAVRLRAQVALLWVLGIHIVCRAHAWTVVCVEEEEQFI